MAQHQGVPVSHSTGTSLIRLVLCSALLLLAVSIPAAAQEPIPLTPVSYTSLHADSSGTSHFGNEALPWTTVDPSGTHRAAVDPVQQVTIVRFGQGLRQDWHPAPRRQFIIVLEGVVEVVAGDGERREFGPGSVLFVADTEGAGHQTNVLGEKDLVVAMIAVASGN